MTIDEIEETIRKAEIVSGMLSMCERIAYGSDTEAIDGLIKAVHFLRKENKELRFRIQSLEK